MNISHSTWPVVLIPYNLPPWLCIKQSWFILSVLIDGPKAPGDKIDVYLQLLIDELKDLWRDGVSTYDASSKRHRRWLKENNKLRRDKAAFNGEPEWDPRPRVLSGSELLNHLRDVETLYKKEDVYKKRKREELEKENERERKVALRSEKRKMKEKMKGNGKMNVKVKQKATNSNEKEGNEHERQDNWKKKSIFFKLVYWDFLPIRHNLDVMHIEKMYLLTLKMYVRNRARPEGCIAKGALMEECMTFCTRRHLRSLQKLAPRERQRIHNKEFPSWFRVDVLKQVAEKRFRTKEMDNSRVTQNSGVVVTASTPSFSSRKDKNPMSGELTYYGKLTDIIEVRYTDETKFVLFKCNWVDNMTGVKVDN
nr:hypothetical protein [Tanacetum cinerariifolium]